MYIGEDRTKTSGPTTSTSLSRALCFPVITIEVEPKYDSGYKTWEIQWLDSLITYNIDDKKIELHKHTDKPKEAIGIGFSINTSVQAMPSDIFLDWILAYKCAVL